MLTQNKNQPPAFNSSHTFQGHGIWQFEDFLNANQQVYGAKEIGRTKQKEVKTNFAGDEEETVEFELTLMSDGSSIKGSFTTTPGKGKGGGGRGKDGSFTLDLSNIRSEAQAREAFEKFHALTIAFDLKTHPANSPLNIFTHGDSKWKALGDQTKIEALLKRAGDFRERGIEVRLNNQLIVGPKPKDDFKNSSTQATKKPKPWEVQKIPKLTRDH